MVIHKYIAIMLIESEIRSVMIATYDFIIPTVLAPTPKSVGGIFPLAHAIDRKLSVVLSPPLRVRNAAFLSQ
jgi:hypothetical protein